MQVITDYTRQDYREINRNLLQGIVTQKAATLIEAVKSLPERSGTTYRTFWLDDLDTYLNWLLDNRKNRLPLTFVAFSSTSRSSGISAKFNGNVRLTIHGRTGRDIAALSEKPGEQETIYLPGLRCQIQKVKAGKLGGRVWSIEIELTEL